MIILLVAAAVVTGTPLIAAVLVTIASLREDAGHSLTGRAPSWIDAAARRLLRVEPSGAARRATPRVPRPRIAERDEATRQLTKPRA